MDMDEEKISVVTRAWNWVKSMYIRITLTKTTAAFFLFSFLFCFTHSLVQSFLFALDANAEMLTSSVISAANVPSDKFAWLTRSHNSSTSEEIFTLRMCSAIPMERAKDSDPCVVVFETGAGVLDIQAGFKKRDESTLPSGSDLASSNLSLPSANSFNLATSAGHIVEGIAAFVQPFVDPNTGDVTAVAVSQDGFNGGQPAILDAQCTRVVVYADQVLMNSKREELALIGSEFWMFGISLFAIMYDSIPHLLAALSFRFLSTVWSAYAIWRTEDIDFRFRSMITEGACGIDLFPGYFKMRIALQISDLSLNVIALLLSCFLVHRLAKVYSSFMFQRVGAPDHVIRLYRLFLGLFTCLQLAVYLLLTSIALWVDQLVNGAIARISSHTTIYIGLFVFTLVALIPWLASGWRAVRKELRRTLYVFLGIGGIYLVGWALMYYSLVFRWTWIQWPFFASTTVAAQIVLLASVVLGGLCSRGFGQGLRHYLHVTAVLAKDDFEPEVFDNTVKGNFGDAEKGGRLSLDFGAHQPQPPPSPPAYNQSTEAIVALPLPSIVRPTTRVSPISRVSPPASNIRPESFTIVLPSLPTLGKNDPWKSQEKDADDLEGLGI